MNSSLLKSISLASLMMTSVVWAQSTKPVVIAIMDYEINTKDPRFKGKVYINSSETSETEDGDQNGFAGDIEGWNRALGNGQVFKSLPGLKTHLDDLLDLNHLTQITYSRKLKASELEEAQRLYSAIPARAIKAFHSNLHGTHVTGISLKDTKNTQFVPVVFTNDEYSAQLGDESRSEVAKAIQDPEYKVDPFFLQGVIQHKLYALKEIRNPLFPVVNAELRFLKPSFDFLKTRPIRVVNMSFSSGIRQNLAQVLNETWRSNFNAVVKDEYVYEYIHGAQKYASTQLFSWMLANNDKLFVLASGNTEGSIDEAPEANNNDTDPYFPTSVAKWFDVKNLIVVAATNGRTSLADFSDYGDETVDVAAPGVRVSSYMPQGGDIELSGTSMAAPYVTNTAALMLEENFDLESEQLKKMIVATVDKKAFLKGKVRSSGIVNPVRAVRAAQLSLKIGIDKAIAQSRKEIKDL